MVGIGIALLGVVFIIIAMLLRQNKVAAILAARQKEVMSVGDLTRWWKLHLTCMGVFTVLIAMASFGFQNHSPWIFVGAACFIIAIFGSMAMMGVKLLEKKEPIQK